MPSDASGYRRLTKRILIYDMLVNEMAERRRENPGRPLTGEARPVQAMRRDIAAIMSDSGAALPYAELERRSVQLANLLTARGLVAGDRVAILMENALDWYVAMWGARRAAMFFVPINWHLKPAEIRYVVDNSDARAIVASASLAELAQASCEGLVGVDVRLSSGGPAGGFEDLEAALSAHPPTPGGPEMDGGSMLYSSGTTGHPKGILRRLSNGAFGAPNELERMLAETYSIDPQAIYLSPAPMYHASPVGFTGTVLRQGGTVVLMPSFDAEAVLAAIEKHRITHAQFVPTHFVRLLRLPDEVKARYDLSSLRVVIHAAAPCAPDVKRAMIDWLGPIIYEYYAGSEGCGLTAINSAEWLAHPGSVGRSRTSPIRIVDLETGAELPAGEIGGIYFESPGTFSYHKDAAKSASALTPQGWGTLGDVGHVDEDGYLYLSDRRSDLILSGGVNIYPQEIENALSTHPAVADVAVIGVPNPEFGQEVKAVVELLPGAAAVSEAELIAYAREHLAHFKAPKSIDFTSALPRLPNGKLLRRRLVEQYSLPKDQA